MTMPRVSNVGGMMGFGPVDPTDRYTPFEYVWEARVWAISVLLTAKGVLPLDAKRDAGEQMSADEYREMSYYERWLFSVEMLLADLGLLDIDELDEAVLTAERERGGTHQPWHTHSLDSQWEVPYE
jgi:hypothetical protein